MDAQLDVQAVDSAAQPEGDKPDTDVQAAKAPARPEVDTSDQDEDAFVLLRRTFGE